MLFVLFFRVVVAARSTDCRMSRNLSLKICQTSILSECHYNYNCDCFTLYIVKMFFIIVYTHTHTYTRPLKINLWQVYKIKTKNRKKYFIIYKVTYITFQFVWATCHSMAQSFFMSSLKYSLAKLKSQPIASTVHQFLVLKSLHS